MYNQERYEEEEVDSRNIHRNFMVTRLEREEYRHFYHCFHRGNLMSFLCLDHKEMQEDKWGSFLCRSVLGKETHHQRIQYGSFHSEWLGRNSWSQQQCQEFAAASTAANQLWYKKEKQLGNVEFTSSRSIYQNKRLDFAAQVRVTELISCLF